MRSRIGANHLTENRRSPQRTRFARRAPDANESPYFRFSHGHFGGVASWRRSDESDTLGLRRGGKVMVQRRKRDPPALRQLEIGGVVETQAMASGQCQDANLIRQRCKLDGRSLQTVEKADRVALGDPLSPLTQKQDVANLEPPMQRHESAIVIEQIEGCIGTGIMLVMEAPACRDRCIQDVWQVIGAPRHARREFPRSMRGRLGLAFP
jgi:hypothetical protein